MNKIVNPIIPGFTPDPTICRVGDDFYIAVSSMELDPGIPLYHSKDLAHWELICNVMSADNGFHVKQNTMIGGMMAPTLRYHNGTYYIIAANFSHDGNFIVTAEKPEGPWSKPHWLTDVPGIDASIFFDNDGRCYLIGTGMVWKNEGGRMERGIWIAEYDLENYKLIGEPFTIFNSALRVGSAPESPHIYHIGDYYHLIIAEGGTEHYHAVMHARSKELFSFFEANPANPVLTHRHMGFSSPIINIGHADITDLPDGSWAAVMLGTRLVDGTKLLGRETFYCPLVWERDWPLFSPETGKVEWEYEAPASLPWTEYPAPATRFDFDDEKLDPRWVNWGTPYGDPYRIADSKLYIRCIPQDLNNKIRTLAEEKEVVYDHFAPLFGIRQTQPVQTAAVQMYFKPEEGESAGLAMIRAMNHQLHFERCCEDGKQLLRLVFTTCKFNTLPYFPGFKSENCCEVLAQTECDRNEIVLKAEMNGTDFRFYCGNPEDDLKEFATVDAKIICPEQIGCMTGNLIGIYATGNGKDSSSEASFDWFELK
ncbi:MAG: glycoside hydrolase family 43 protein [Blautia sp.]|nr:glycoside hydrolase family 43 protein [Blautia sp.]